MSDDVVFEPFSEETYDKRPANWRRWMPDPIQTTAPSNHADTPPDAEDAGVRLKNSLARLRERAQGQGYDEGYTKGHADGLERGFDEGHKKGHEEGYRAGYEAGHSEGLEFAQDAAQNLAGLAQQCALALTDIESDIGQDLITLAVRIAEQVLHTTIQAQPESLLAVIDDILHLDTGKSALLQLYVNPDDAQLIRDYLQDNPDTKLWRVLPDATITRGGCKASTALGDIDATIEKRWERVVSSIGGSL